VKVKAEKGKEVVKGGTPSVPPFTTDDFPSLDVEASGGGDKKVGANIEIKHPNIVLKVSNLYQLSTSFGEEP